MSSLPLDLPAGWYKAADRVPRQDQLVRILTQNGNDHRARFVVAFTEAWPSGVSWALENGRESLPFAGVLVWSPDPDARPPLQARAEETLTEESPVELPVPRPAILTEVLIEVERTGTLLRLPAPAQLDWSPHPAVPTLRDLAWRLVRLVDRIGWILELEQFDVFLETPLPLSDEILNTYLASQKTVREMIEGLDADAMRAPWALERNGVEIARLPRGDALRTFGLTPLAYYRGELAQLLTALGTPVPHASPIWRFSDGEAIGGWEVPA